MMTSMMFFTGTGCFKGNFSLEVKEGAMLYQVPPGYMAYALEMLLQTSGGHFVNVPPVN